MLEEKIQERFFNIVARGDEIPEGTQPGLLTYRNLVFHRYKEVILNAFPLLRELTGKTWMRHQINIFRKRKIQSEFIWMLPHEFLDFLHASGAFSELPELPWAEELAFYEWLEIELFMKLYDFPPVTKFSYETSYQISPSARLQKFSFPVFRGEFSPDLRGEYHVVTFYNFKTHQINYREITKSMFQLLSVMQNERTLGFAVEQLAKAEGIDANETRDILEETLTDFLRERIIVERRVNTL